MSAELRLDDTGMDRVRAHAARREPAVELDREEHVRGLRPPVRDPRGVAAALEPRVLEIDAGGVKGKRMTSWPSLRRDLENAGARWEDAEVVVDDGLVTSRKPEDLPAFNDKLIEEVCEGRHAA